MATAILKVVRKRIIDESKVDINNKQSREVNREVNRERSREEKKQKKKKKPTQTETSKKLIENQKAK